MQIGLAGLTPLDTLAFKWICRRLGWDDPVCLTAPDGSVTTQSDCDILIASAAEIALSPDLYMGRRGHIIVFDERGGREPVSQRVLTRDMEEDEIMSRLDAAARTLHGSADSPDTRREALSARETEVLKEIASGKTNKEIADSLCISVNTVITHRKNLTSKLGIRSASGLSLYALMHGLLDAPL
ncbi:MAG: response regulator transcription factor [Muribaculaceae bacterium]|nr:response regulator transcription factor [Muribaculaceae bacterium]